MSTALLTGSHDQTAAAFDTRSPDVSRARVRAAVLGLLPCPRSPCLAPCTHRLRLQAVARWKFDAGVEALKWNPADPALFFAG